MIDPVNRKAKRTFEALWRRKRLRLLARTRLFTPGFVKFAHDNAKDRW